MWTNRAGRLARQRAPPAPHAIASLHGIARVRFARTDPDPMLWLCIHLPFLPLDIFRRGIPEEDDVPFAVLDGVTVHTPNRRATEDGVRTGMRQSAALALSPRLRRRARNRQAERQALERLAGWSLQFTPMVSLQPPRALLLEIGGSLRYFGGLQALRERLTQGLTGLGYRFALAIAPTPTAAGWLARAGRERPVTRVEQLPEALADLPAGVLDPRQRQRDALAGLGLHTLGDCRAQPRDGLARRFGPELFDQLDRAHGHLAEPRESWQPPPRFRGELELPTESADTGQLLYGLEHLVRELCGDLAGRQSGTQRFRIELSHLHRPATTFDVGLVAPSRDAEHLLELIRQRLERLVLPAPVSDLRLVTRHIQRLSPRSGNLIEDDHRNHGEEWGALIERLSARLGEDAVRGLEVREAHRPEYAWGYGPPGRQSPAAPWAERPLWLLSRPLLLTCHGGDPAWHGPLRLDSGPERIESGWWDGADVARDYYIARNPGGERVWIFRECRDPRAWYLHGVFA